MDERFIELATQDLSGEISQDEWNELQAFLKDAVYKAYYQSFRMYWENKETNYNDDSLSFQKIKSKIARHETINPTNTPEDKSTTKTSLFTFWRQIAAALVICGCSYLAYQYFSANEVNPAVTFHEKTTASRTKSIIVLSDGTRITLNAQSTLKYPSAFSGKTREVYLSGEAFFNVHKDHRHPFIIHTGKMNVRVLGTEFNVRSYPGESLSETSLIRGSIEVTLNDRPSDHIILKPKEKLIVKNSEATLELTKPKTSDFADNHIATQYTLTSLTHLNKKDTTVVETSWLDNKLVVSNEEFADLARKMDRWYGIRIHFSNQELQKLRFTASFEKEDINQALDALKLTENFHYKRDKLNVYIY